MSLCCLLSLVQMFGPDGKVMHEATRETQGEFNLVAEQEGRSSSFPLLCLSFTVCLLLLSSLFLPLFVLSLFSSSYLFSLFPALVRHPAFGSISFSISVFFRFPSFVFQQHDVLSDRQNRQLHILCWKQHSHRSARRGQER